jgi:hypothetical protein
MTAPRELNGTIVTFYELRLRSRAITSCGECRRCGSPRRLPFAFSIQPCHRRTFGLLENGSWRSSRFLSSTEDAGGAALRSSRATNDSTRRSFDSLDGHDEGASPLAWRRSHRGLTSGGFEGRVHREAQAIPFRQPAHSEARRTAFPMTAPAWPPPFPATFVDGLFALAHRPPEGAFAFSSSAQSRTT